MEEMTAVVAIAATLTLGVISPGPSFIMVARTAVARSRGQGLAAAVGMGLGGVLFALASLLGLHLVLTALPLLYAVLKIGGGIWLLILASKIWRGATTPLDVGAIESGTDRVTRTLGNAFLLGLVTQVSNPKTAVVYASVFAALLPDPIPAGLFLFLPPLVFVIETGWYALVAFGLSTPAPRAAYVRGKAWIDRAAAGALGILGLKLISSARDA